jgi:hypothetical protein
MLLPRLPEQVAREREQPGEAISRIDILFDDVEREVVETTKYQTGTISKSAALGVGCSKSKSAADSKPRNRKRNPLALIQVGLVSSLMLSATCSNPL